MRSFVICLFLAVASSAPSGVEHGVGGPTTVAPFAGTHIGGFYNGHATSAPAQIAPLHNSHNTGYHGQSAGLQTIATFTGTNSGGGVYGAQNSGGYFGGNTGYYGNSNGYYGHGGNGGHGAILSTAGNSFGNSHASQPIGNSGPFVGLSNGHSTAGAINGGSYGGLSNGHLTAGAINSGYGGFSGAPIDGHITAGSAGNFNNGFNNGFDGHLTAGAGISTGGSGSLSGSIEGPTAGPLLPIGGPTGPIGGPYGPTGSDHIEQGPVVTKDFYFHTAAEDYDESVVSKTINLGPSRKHYRVVFIKAPSQSAKAAALQILQAQNEEKTVIYVLSKKNDAAEIHTEIQAQKNSHSKPEVFFIKYKTPEEAIHAQKQIQAQYDSLGGVSRFSDEGVSPVTSIVGSLGQTGPGSVGGHGFAAEGSHNGGFAGAGNDNFGGAFINDASASSASTAAFAAGAIHHPTSEPKIIHSGHGIPSGPGLFTSSNQGGAAALAAEVHGSHGGTGDGYLPPKH